MSVGHRAPSTYAKKGAIVGHLRDTKVFLTGEHKPPITRQPTGGRETEGEFSSWQQQAGAVVQILPSSPW